jgi:ABC-type transport system involved in multi-copper enzyme maturation permease subunit
VNPARFILGEAGHEFRSAIRGPLVPLIFSGLVGYVAIVVLSAEYMQQMGAANVARNSAHVVQLMTIGQSFWLFFAWAWLFSRAVTRDQDARLHEVVLAAPISLPQLIVGRYLGVLGVAVLLGLSTPLGFLAVHPLEMFGALPSNLVGPPPVGAMLWGWLLFTVTSGIGVGALYLAVALQTRGAAAPFAVAALLMAIWMFAMVILRGGDISPTVATLIDPTGFGEAEAQTKDWTPVEKMTNLVAFTPALLFNRILWVLLPALPLIGVLVGLRRETLVLDRSRPKALRDDPPPERRAAEPESIDIDIESASSPLWIRATLQEARWQLERSLGSWGVWIAMGLLCFMCVAGSFVHVVGHTKGPLVPRPELLVPMVAEFLYITIAFVIAGFVGVMMRRDEEVGFYEVVGTVPAPLGVRLCGRVIAAGGLTVTMMLVPIVACYVVTGLAAPSSFAIGTPIVHFGLVYAPALLELCAVTLLCHAVFRASGVAYAVSMFLTFIFVVNHEFSLVTHPLAAVGLPPDVSLSALVGWAPWLPLALALSGFKLGVFVLATGLAWFAWSRGYVDRWTDRIWVALKRLRGGASVTLTAGLAVTIGVAAVVQEQLVVRGDYQSAADEDAVRADWERRWLQAPADFEVEGGDIEAALDPARQTAAASWTLRGVRSPKRRLQGELPAGVEVTKARVEGRPVSVETAAETFGLALGPCAEQTPGCTVELGIRAERQGWPVEGETPWIQSSQVWMTATDLLPRLGLDPHRAIRSPTVRQELRLPAERPNVPKKGAVSAIGVAPAGRWRWTIEVPEGWSLPTTGRTDGPLDFAVVWRTRAPPETGRGPIRAVHGPTHGATAYEALDDLQEMQTCVAERLGVAPSPVQAIVQAPRNGEVAVRGTVLWLPEDRGWDVVSTGYGRWHRRYSVAKALAAQHLAKAANLRREAGTRWLLEGVPGWVGLSCVRELDGDRAWLALVHRASEAVVQELGALEAPVEGVALDGSAGWIEPYAAQSTFAWAQMTGEDTATRVVASVVQQVRAGRSLRAALEQAAGSEAAEQLLQRPLASDVAVVDTANAGKIFEPARRWTWSGGGWQSAGRPAQVLLLPHGVRSNGPMVRITASSDAAVRVTKPTTLLDVWPSFERSIADNVWSPSDHDPVRPRGDR